MRKLININTISVLKNTPAPGTENFFHFFQGPVFRALEKKREPKQRQFFNQISFFIQISCKQNAFR